MKKEKTVRTYQRRTKSGKIVTVRQHTAKYDAAEALKEAAKKKGAGDELEALKKKSVDKPTEEEVAEFEKLLDSFPEELDERSRKIRLKQFMKAKGKKGRQAEIDETKWEIKEEKKARKVWKANEGFGKRLEKSYDKEHKNSVKDSKDPYSAHGFTKDEFNEWYEGTGSVSDKKVEKALRKTLGRKAYNELSDLAADNYKKGGASSFFKKNVHSKTAETKTSNRTKKGAAISKRMTLDEYLGSKGLGSPVSDFMIDKTKLPHGLTQRGKEKLRKEADKAANEYQEKRAAAIKEYKKLVKEGKIVAPTSSEQLNKIAEGHPDNASTQAAKRVLEKRAAKAEKTNDYTIVKGPGMMGGEFAVKDGKAYTRDVTKKRPKWKLMKEWTSTAQKVLEYYEALQDTSMPLSKLKRKTSTKAKKTLSAKEEYKSYKKLMDEKQKTGKRLSITETTKLKKLAKDAGVGRFIE